jgi:thioredoxin-related protein
MVKIIYLLFFLAVLVTTVSANDSFILDSIEEAQRLSQLTNKPALIIFGADYCKFCNSLKEDILNNSLGSDIKDYIICYVDIKENVDLKEKYNISMIPDSRIFIDAREIKRIKGYSKNNYMKWLSK